MPSPLSVHSPSDAATTAAGTAAGSATGSGLGEYGTFALDNATGRINFTPNAAVTWLTRVGPRRDIGLALSPVAYFAQFALDIPCVAMVTASHNPKEYNGFKVYWNDGAQVIGPFSRVRNSTLAAPGVDGRATNVIVE